MCKASPAVLVVFALIAAGGCADSVGPRPGRPLVTPATQPAAVLSIGDARIEPMYREVLAVDLPTVARVATARGLDVQAARERVAASEGRYESRVEAVFPVIAPAFTYQHLEGDNQNANGSLV